MKRHIFVNPVRYQQSEERIRNTQERINEIHRQRDEGNIRHEETVRDLERQIQETNQKIENIKRRNCERLAQLKLESENQQDNKNDSHEIEQESEASQQVNEASKDSKEN